VGPADYFTGAVRIDPLFQAPDPAGVRGASTFELGARAAWHTHPLGQTLIVTSGRGWAQVWGSPVEEINPADVVWFPPGEQDGAHRPEGETSRIRLVGESLRVARHDDHALAPNSLCFVNCADRPLWQLCPRVRPAVRDFRKALSAVPTDIPTGKLRA